MMRHWLTAWLLLVCSPGFASPMVVRHFGSAEGMPVSSATSAQIDRDGFLWLATHDGLARFDGRQFSVFDSARFPEIGSNRIVRLYAGQNGNIYGVGARGEWLGIDSHGIRRLRLDQDDPEAVVKHVTKIADVAGSVRPDRLCVTLSSGLFCEVNSRTQAAGAPFELRRRFAKNWQVAAALPSGSSDWLVVQGRGIFHAMPGQMALVFPDVSMRFANHLRINAEIAADGSLVIDAPQGLLQLFPNGRKRWLEFDPEQHVDLLQLHVDSGGYVQINTPFETYRISPSGERETVVARTIESAEQFDWHVSEHSHDGAAARLIDDSWRSRGGTLYRNDVPVLQARGTIQDVLFADSGVVWVCTNRDGVYALSSERVDALADQTLAQSNVYGTSVSADGSVWIGSLGGGIFHAGADDRVQQFGMEDGLPGPFTLGVKVAPDQTVFAFALSRGLWQLRPGASRFESVALPSDLTRAQHASLSFDRQSRLWLAGTEGAWFRDALAAETDESAWHKAWPNSPQPEPSGLNVLAVLHDPGRVWFGTNRGLYWHDSVLGRLQATESQAVTALANIPVRSLFRADDGSLWVATEGQGLFRCAADDAPCLQPLRLGRAQGLPSNSPHVVIQDRAGDFWINSNQGIFRLTKAEVSALQTGASRTLLPLSLGLADGLQELEGNGGVQPAADIDNKGRIWFPTQRGMARFHPDQVGPAYQPGQPIIEAISSEGKPVPLAASVPLQLPLGARNLTIRYNAAELNAGQVWFRYRLSQSQNKSASWVDAGSRNLAGFDALGPGQYLFEVQAGNSNGVWQPTPSALQLVVPAYFHETTLFRWGLAGLLLVLAGWAVRARIRRGEQRALHLAEVVRERTDELSLEKHKLEQALSALARSHEDLNTSHLEIASRNQRLAEQATRLESLDRFRTRLLADVSHELRSPLMLVNLPLQELSSRALPEADQRLVALASQQTGRLSHLVEQLVSLVQAEEQQMQLQLRRLSLRALVAQVVAGFAPVSLQSGVRFVVHGADDESIPWLYADAQHITTVLSNFLDNASKYAPANSTVHVRVVHRVAEESVRVEVHDSGPGFPPELAGRLFERFFRAEGPPRAGREGLGVGLALAHELMVLHGGRIGAINGGSEWTGTETGACFWFELPLGSAHVGIDELVLDAPEAGPNPVLTFAGDTTARSLLLVEDHPVLAAYLAERLAEHCPVMIAPDAEVAWARLQQDPIALVVSDVVLPGQSGVELCRRIKSDPTRAAMPVLLISAKANKADRQSGLDAGAYDWLTKPFSLSTLIHAVQQAWPDMKPVAAPSSQDTEPEATTSADQVEPPVQAPKDRLLDLALARLHGADFGLPEWAERAHLSERQLRRRVSELTGLSPVAWLREQRLLRVRELVASGACRTLAEAGTMAGIDNPGYLYRLYRARFGS